MSRIWFGSLTAAAVIAATSFLGGTTVWASATAHSPVHAHVTAQPEVFEAHGFGQGPTAAAAKTAASDDLRGNYRGCATPFALNYDTQGPDGMWSAEVSTSCSIET
jgi:hypothetical protein